MSLNSVLSFINAAACCACKVSSGVLICCGAAIGCTSDSQGILISLAGEALCAATSTGDVSIQYLCLSNGYVGSGTRLRVSFPWKPAQFTLPPALQIRPAASSIDLMSCERRSFDRRSGGCTSGLTLSSLLSDATI